MTLDGLVAPEESELASKECNFLVGIPVSSSQPPLGRDAKGFVGYDLDGDRLVFVKDYWRDVTSGSYSECDIYIRLNEKNIDNVAKLLAGGNVGAPVAQRSLLAINGWESRIHTRVVLDTVGRPLETYECGLIMVKIVWDCLNGERCSYNSVKSETHASLCFSPHASLGNSSCAS